MALIIRYISALFRAVLMLKHVIGIDMGFYWEVQEFLNMA
jgi:hypothetical protein